MDQITVSQHKLRFAVRREPHWPNPPVILTDQAACEGWLNAPPDEIEAIQTSVLPSDVLKIVGDEEAAQYVGGYIK